MDRLGYFRFSKLMDKVNYLDYWFNDFCRRGVPCFIARHQYPFGYTLWKKGIDAHHPKRDDTHEDAHLDGVVVREYPEPEKEER